MEAILRLFDYGYQFPKRKRILGQEGEKMKKKKRDVKELGQEIGILDHALSALVEILEEKGIMINEEWEQKIKAKIEHTAKFSKSFREVK